MKHNENERQKKSFRMRILRLCTLGGLVLGALLFVCVIDLPVTRRINSTVRASLNLNADETLLGGIMEKFTNVYDAWTSPSVTLPKSDLPQLTPAVESSVQIQPPETLSFRIDEDILAMMEEQTDMYLHNNQ